MKRSNLNAIVDFLAYVGLVVLTTTGFLLRYQLPPGSGGIHGTGMGQGEQSKSVSLLWGFSRHEWGSFHYWIALILLGFLAVHLVLHWKWIVCVIRGHPRGDASGQRFALGMLGLIGVVLLACAPLISPTQSVSRSLLQEESTIDHKAAREDLESIRGSMTFEDVENQTGVPMSYLRDQLGLPDDISLGDQVGRTLRAHGLEMQNLRRLVEEYQPEK